jgi:hypothetical protein
MAWQVGAIHDTSDFIGFNIIDATSQRPIVTFSYSSRDEAAIAHGLVAKALENAKHIGLASINSNRVRMGHNIGEIAAMMSAY